MPVNYQVNWGDSENIESWMGNAIHEYIFRDGVESIRPTITINGSFPVLHFIWSDLMIAAERSADANRMLDDDNNELFVGTNRMLDDDDNELSVYIEIVDLEIVQWGLIPFEVMEYGFANCRNLKISADDRPNLTKVQSLRGLFSKCHFDDPLDNWNVSTVTDMGHMFAEATNFNQSLNNWNVSNVTNMSNMFSHALSFNQSLNNWNVSNVTNMSNMFFNAITFDRPLNNWTVFRVTDMSGMFAGAESFNKSLASWNVSNVTDMLGMFAGARSFNKSLANWNVSNVTDMSGMFYEAESFDQPLANWNVSNVTNMSDMFHGARMFDQPLANWNVSNVRNMSNMFDDTDMSQLPEWYLLRDENLEEIDPNLHKQLVERNANLIERARARAMDPVKRLNLDIIRRNLVRDYGFYTAEFVLLFLDSGSTKRDVDEVLMELKNRLVTDDINLENALFRFLKDKKMRPLFSNGVGMDPRNARPCKNVRSSIDLETMIYLQPDNNIVYDGDGYCYTRAEAESILQNSEKFRNSQGTPFSELNWYDHRGNLIIQATVLNGVGVPMVE